MDTRHTQLAERCLKAAHDGSMAFPEIIGTLMEAGFDGYTVDYRRETTTYFLADGESLVLDHHATGSGVAEGFDRDGVVAGIRWAQSGAPDYSYETFSAQVKACGCAGYIVSFPGRRVLYYGRTAETHVEHFPGAQPSP